MVRTASPENNEIHFSTQLPFAGPITFYSWLSFSVDLSWCVLKGPCLHLLKRANNFVCLIKQQDCQFSLKLARQSKKFFPSNLCRAYFKSRQWLPLLFSLQPRQKLSMACDVTWMAHRSIRIKCCDSFIFCYEISVIAGWLCSTGSYSAILSLLLLWCK